MAWNDLKAAVAAVIKTNGTQAITGALLQSTLNSIIDQVGVNSTFKGIAIPSTNPGTPDGPVFYLAATSGTYSNFGGFVFGNDLGLAVISNISGAWVGTKILSNLVDTSSNQQITGSKTFSVGPIVPGADSDNKAQNKAGVETQITARQEAARSQSTTKSPTSKLVDDEFNKTVQLTGNQSVDGVKTFLSSPVVPIASGDAKAQNKAGVETQITARQENIRSQSTTKSPTSKLMDDLITAQAADITAVSAKAEADAIQLLRLHDPNLVFSGFVNTGTATPPHSNNKAYIATVSGTIFGIAGVVKGQIIKDNGTNFIVEAINIKLDNIVYEIQNVTDYSLSIAGLNTGSGTPTGSLKRVLTNFISLENSNTIVTANVLYCNGIWFFKDGVYVSDTVINSANLNVVIPPSTSYNQIRVQFAADATTSRNILQADLDAIEASLIVDREKLIYSNIIKSFTTALGISYDPSATPFSSTDLQNVIDEIYNYMVYQNNLELPFTVGLGGLNVGSGVIVEWTTKRFITSVIPVTKELHLTADLYFCHGVWFFLDGSYVSDTAVMSQTLDLTIPVSASYNEIRVQWGIDNTDTIVVTQTHLDAMAAEFKALYNNIGNEVTTLLQSQINTIAERVTVLENANNVGITIDAIGDSITWGFTPYNTAGKGTQLDCYAKQYCERKGFTFINHGIISSTVTNETGKASSAMCTRYSTMNDAADIILVLGGVNDFKASATLGTIADTTDQTFYGAYKILVQGLINKYVIDQGLAIGKTKRIVLCTPFKTTAYSGVVGDLKTGLELFCDAIKEIAAFYSLEVCDFYNNSGINPHINQTVVGSGGFPGLFNPYITDGVHPTVEGHYVISKYLEKFLGI